MKAPAAMMQDGHHAREGLLAQPSSLGGAAAGSAAPVQISAGRSDLPVHSTLTQAGFAVVRSIVGPAMLYLPHGVATAGLSASAVIFVLSYALFIFGASKLVECWRWHQEDQKDQQQQVNFHTAAAPGGGGDGGGGGGGGMAHLSVGSATSGGGNLHVGGGGHGSGHGDFGYPELARHFAGPWAMQITQFGIIVMQVRPHVGLSGLTKALMRTPETVG